MKFNEEIISLINNLIESMKTEFDKKNELNEKFNLEELEKIQETLKRSIDKFENIANLDISYISKIVQDREAVEKLKFYKKTVTMRDYFQFMYRDEEVAKEIKNLLNNILVATKSIIDSFQKAMQINEEEINKLRTINDKLKSESYSELTTDEIAQIMKILKENEKTMDLFIELAEHVVRIKGRDKRDIENLRKVKTTKEDDVEAEEEEIKENENTKEIEKQIIEIFTKYGLSYDSFMKKTSKDTKEDFLLKVKPKNVDEILSMLKEYNIDLNDYYFDTKLLELKNCQLMTIFKYSNANIIKRVLDMVIEFGGLKNDAITTENKKEGIDFELLLRYPARFIEKKRRYVRRGNKKVNIETEKTPSGESHKPLETTGSAEDFINNVELFSKFGINLIELLSAKTTKGSKGAIIISIKSTEDVKKIIKALDFYGIPRENYLKTLSCFNSIRQCEVIDAFMELGLFDYIKNNLSRCQKLPNDEIFYRLVYAIKHTHDPMNTIVNSFGLQVKITEEGPLGIGKDNKEDKVKQYQSPIRNNEILKKIFDEIDPLATDISELSNEKNTVIEMLDDNFLKKDENGNMLFPEVYTFGDMIAPSGRKIELLISRKKVQRILNQLIKKNVNIDEINTIMYVITYNSILSKEEYDIIKSYVQSVMQKKQGVRR